MQLTFMSLLAQMQTIQVINSFMLVYSKYHSIWPANNTDDFIKAFEIHKNANKELNNKLN